MKKVITFILLTLLIVFPLVAKTFIYEEDASIASSALDKTILMYGERNLKSVAIKFTNALGVTLETSIMVQDPNGATKELDSTNWIVGEQGIIYIPPENGSYPLVEHYATGNKGFDRLLITTDKAEAGNGVSIEVICED